MDNMKQNGMNVGTASILLIFAVLSLISFATLAFVNSRADYKLSNNLAERQIQYYEACHKGNAFVAAVNSGYTEGLQDGIIKKNIPLTDNQSLDITLFSDNANNSANFTDNYSIIQWQVVNNADNDYDYTLPVFK